MPEKKETKVKATAPVPNAYNIKTNIVVDQNAPRTQRSDAYESTVKGPNASKPESMAHNTPAFRQSADTKNGKKDNKPGSNTERGETKERAATFMQAPT